MIERLLNALEADQELAERMVVRHVEAPHEASFGEWPTEVAPALKSVLKARGIAQPYSHQAEAWQHIFAGDSTMVVTPTASGKSLCYNLPILSRILEGTVANAVRPMLGSRSSGRKESTQSSVQPSAEGVSPPAPKLRPAALYLFPTKALSQDQTSELNELVAALSRERGDSASSSFAAGGDQVGAYTYDGDTPGDLRRVLREKGDIIVTNPYMLHVAILPNHLRWGSFFRRLRYIVIDELHVYGGIFGSSVANVLRRLRRIAQHYGSDPSVIACSATIKDPSGHFERMTELTPKLINQSGAPTSKRHHVFWNPPVVNPALGLRARAVDEVRLLGRRLLEKQIPSIFFGRSRTTVEVLTKYLKDAAAELGQNPERVVGYRGGYLPDLRRRIERGLRSGEILMVAATNALELGVDIGALDAVVMTGYPGTVASYRQQSGRAGRRSGSSLSLLVGSSLPLDQYVMSHPEFVLDPDHHGGGTVADPDNLVIATQHLKCAAFELPFQRDEAFGTFPHTQEMLEILSAPSGVLLSKGDRYHWMSQAFPAEEVSLDAVESDTFVVLEEEPTGEGLGQNSSSGRARSLGHVDRPQALTTLHPNAIYQHQGVQYQVSELDWEGRRAYAKRVKVDWYTEAETEIEVQVLSEDDEEPLDAARTGFGDVHVTTLATLFKRIRFYTNENLETGPIDLPPEEMDTTAWWLVIDEALEQQVRFRESTRSGAIMGLAQLFRGVAPLFVQMGAGAIRARGFGCHTHWNRPAALLWDSVPGGVGLAERLFNLRSEVFAAARDLLARCPCKRGCPSCIGLGGDLGAPAKAATMEILQYLTSQTAAPGRLQRSPEAGGAGANAIREIAWDA